MSEAEAKKKRRNCVASVKRHIKTLDFLIDNNRPTTEVVTCAKKLSECYQNTLTRHEEVTMYIDEDDEDAFSLEEDWIDNIRKLYLTNDIRAIDYIKTQTDQQDLSHESGLSNLSYETGPPHLSNETVQTAPPHPSNETGPPNLSPETGPPNLSPESGLPNVGQQSGLPNVGQQSGLPNVGQQSGPPNVGQQSGLPNIHQPRFDSFRMERPKFPRFSGDVREYQTFKSDFKHAAETNYNKRDCIQLLRTCLSGKPLQLIHGIGADYDAAWEYLDAIYGDPRYIADTISQDISLFKPLRNGEDERFCELVHLVRRSYNALNEIGRGSDLDNNHMLAILENKMCIDDRKVWCREQERSDEPATLGLLLKWLNTEMKSRIRATAPIRNTNQKNVHQLNQSNYGKTNQWNGSGDRWNNSGDNWGGSEGNWNGSGGNRNYGGKNNGMGDNRNSGDGNNIQNTGNMDPVKCWVCKNDHFIDQCPVFLKKSVDERHKMVKSNNACFSCLKTAGNNHNVETCRRRRLCRQLYNGKACQYYHNELLHPVDKPQAKTNSNKPHTVGIAAVDECNTILPTIQCQVLGKHGAYGMANVLYDSGSQISLIKESLAEQLNLYGKASTISITKVGGEMESMQTKVYDVRLKSLSDNRVCTVKCVGIPYISDDSVAINVDGIAEELGLAGRQINRGVGEIDVLMGVDHAYLHGGQIKTKGKMAARLSPLGWVIFGTGAGKQTDYPKVFNIQIAAPVDLTDFWSVESMGVTGKVCDCEEVKLSKVEQMEAKVIDAGCKKVGNQWLISYPWKRDPTDLPDNRAQAVKKLESLEKRLTKEGSEMGKVYDDQIKQLVENNFAHKLSDEELESYSGPVHYVSHHPVIRPESDSTPVRIVFNSSAAFHGHVLNDYWLKGPDMLNNMFGVILRFRENEVALCSDISKMYHRVLIPTVDQNVHRFLWRDMENREPDTYVMNVVSFGDRPSPAMAQTALRKTAEENMEEYPAATKVLLQNVYMDDICESVCTVGDAKKMIADVDLVLSTGGFEVKKWHSNIESVVENQQVLNKEVQMMGFSSQEKILGVVWNGEDDTFSYKVSPEVYGGFANPSVVLTKRTILSRIAQIFDPIGFAASFLVKAKIGMQKLWQLGLDWDDPVPTDVQNDWLTLFKEMEQLNEIKFDRCLTPRSAVGNPSLCIFSDASEDAFGTCAYVRWKMEEGGYTAQFLAAKSRVAPLKRITIPRLELQAAVMAARLYGIIQEECRLQFSDVYFFTDSQIALAWIRSEGRSYKNFVSNRVGEIQSLTNPVQWFHVPGEVNVADDISRGISVSKLNDRWKNGPDFIREPAETWSNRERKPSLEAMDMEKKKVLTVNSVTVKEEVAECSQFSTWRRLLRVTAWIKRFVSNLKSKTKESKSGGSENGTFQRGNLTPQEVDEGELYWVKEAQTGLMNRYSSGEFKTLSPFIDDAGILRVGGRVSESVVSYDTKHPILLPYGHRISMLITRQVHQYGHNGVASMAARVREKYWILKVHDLAKHIKHECVFCKRFKPKSESQFMADLPKIRLEPDSPPFYNTSCDYFGPFNVKISRNKTSKMYGVIFTCLNTRAVHLELAVDYSTMEYMQVLRRFFSVRGQPKLMISDNGTQFVGAEKELRMMIQGWQISELKDFGAARGMEWRFVTPAAPHQNGCAEALVKSCKIALKKAIGEQILAPFELYTCLYDAANLVNQRPIGRLPTDPDDGKYLCPNDILLGRSSATVPQGPFRTTKNPRHRFEFVQKIVDSFWYRWTRDVFPSLVPRKKWSVEKRNVRVDDIVMMADSNSIRGKWTIGRIVEVYPGKDGKVRNVKVKTGNSSYSRPITKIAVIYPAEGDE